MKHIIQECILEYRIAYSGERLFGVSIQKAFIKSIHQQRRRAENRKRQEEMIAREELEKRYKKRKKK